MKVIRDRPAAKWLPARHHFALMRVIALLGARYGGGEERDVDRLVLAIDHDQSALENYGVSIWIFVTVACYIASALPMSRSVAVILSIPLAAVAIQLPVYFAIVVPLWNIATGSKIEYSVKLTSVLFMTLMFIASSYFSAMKSPVRYVGWFFFAVVTLNAAARLVLVLLRNRVRELEQQCGT